MPDAPSDSAHFVVRQLTKKEVAKTAATSGIIGIVLFTLGLAALVAIGVLGSMREGRFQAIAIVLGSFVLLLPSAVILGSGICLLNLSVINLYALLVGKPVYGVDYRRDDRDSE
jgi:hypothetical protein